jgi:uncharacterized protein with HEPN domain
LSDEQLLASLETTLLQIQTLAPSDKAAWDGDGVLQLAVERLWITAGNAAEEYRKAADMPSGVGPWAELYSFRSLLAHALPGQVSSARVWSESVTDLPRLLGQVRAARGAPG